MKSGEHQYTVNLLELSQLKGSKKFFQKRVSESLDELYLLNMHKDKFFEVTFRMDVISHDLTCYNIVQFCFNLNLKKRRCRLVVVNE